MNLVINTINIFSNEESRINTIRTRIDKAGQEAGSLRIITRVISFSHELQSFFEQFSLDSYYIVDFELIKKDKMVESLFAGKEFNICIFSEEFDRDIALHVIARGYNQYFFCDDLSRVERIIANIINENTLKGFNYSKLIYLLIESVDINGILNMVIDSGVNVSNSQFGFAMLKKNVEEIYESPVVHFGRNIDHEVLADMDDFILAFKRHLVLNDSYFLTKKESRELSRKLGVSETYNYLIIKLHISDLFSALLILAKHSAFCNEDVGTVNSMLTLYRAFFKNYERYELTRQLTYVDDLTTVYNRRYLERFIDRLINSSKAKNSCFSIIFLDIDNLKEVNEEYGHLIGSKVIRKISEILKIGIRAFDRVFRFGGDEFSIILPMTDIEGAFLVAERIRRTIETQSLHFESIDTDLHISVTMGIATYPEHGTDSNELLANSDKAMYLAKQKGKNRIEKFIKRI